MQVEQDYSRNGHQRWIVRDEQGNLLRARFHTREQAQAYVDAKLAARQRAFNRPVSGIHGRAGDVVSSNYSGDNEQAIREVSGL